MKKPHLISPAGMTIVRSIHELARARKLPVANVALRYALDRFLFRVFSNPGNTDQNLFFDPSSDISLADTTVTVKGGLTIIFAEGVEPLEGRTTGDADLHLASFPGSMEDYAAILRNGLSGPPAIGPDDGIRFDVEEIRVVQDRDERSGGSVVVPFQLGNLALQLKTDVTFDARPMHQGAPVVEYPPILPGLAMPAARIRRVPFEFMLADKFCAALSNGVYNKRIRDYPDMRLLLMKKLVDPEILAETIAASVRFRNLRLPASIDDVEGLSDAFARMKAERWEIEKNSRNYQIREPFPEMLAHLRADLAPILARAHELTDLPEWASAAP